MSGIDTKPFTRIAIVGSPHEVELSREKLVELMSEAGRFRKARAILDASSGRPPDEVLEALVAVIRSD